MGRKKGSTGRYDNGTVKMQDFLNVYFADFFRIGQWVATSTQKAQNRGQR